MGFTENELRFIEENSDLIEEGLPSLPKLIEKVEDATGLSYAIEKRLKFLLTYNLQGPSIVEVLENTAELTRGDIQGCLVNRTPAKSAKGVPQLPSLYTSRTKVVLYRIEKGAIVKEDKYSLSTKEEFNKIQSEGGYNLVVLDKPECVQSVKNTFGGILRYITRVQDKSGYLSDLAVGVESKSPAEATKAIIGNLPETIKKRWELVGFDKIVTEIVNQVASQIVFKV